MRTLKTLLISLAFFALTACGSSDSSSTSSNVAGIDTAAKISVVTTK